MLLVIECGTPVSAARASTAASRLDGSARMPSCWRRSLESVAGSTATAAGSLPCRLNPSSPAVAMAASAKCGLLVASGVCAAGLALFT